MKVDRTYLDMGQMFVVPPEQAFWVVEATFDDEGKFISVETKRVSDNGKVRAEKPATDTNKAP